MKLHIVSLPHTQTIKEPSSCAYTQKVRRFADMMDSLGHECLVYAGEESDAAGELVTVVGKKEQIGMSEEFDPNLPHWQNMNKRTIRAIARRYSGDNNELLCLIAGRCQQQIAASLPEIPAVEFGIGYSGTFADFRVFESYAWMHTVYGQDYNAAAADGRFYDTVIPNSYDLEEFPFSSSNDGYLLYMGRLIDRKGLSIIDEISKNTQKRVLVAGGGDESIVPDNCEYLGVLGPKERAEVMGNALALIAPTLYIEPFGGVTVEAMLCGTPVITTDWGGFTETIKPGITGFRCRRMSEFMNATELVESLDRRAIRKYAVSNFSTDVVKLQYDKYLKDVVDLKKGRGFYSLSE
jgi:glycosyltransferase involved in cell wall biosynthesis